MPSSARTAESECPQLHRMSRPGRVRLARASDGSSTSPSAGRQKGTPIRLYVAGIPIAGLLRCRVGRTPSRSHIDGGTGIGVRSVHLSRTVTCVDEAALDPAGFRCPQALAPERCNRSGNQMRSAHAIRTFPIHAIEILTFDHRRISQRGGV